MNEEQIDYVETTGSMLRVGVTAGDEARAVELARDEAGGAPVSHVDAHDRGFEVCFEVCDLV